MSDGTAIDPTARRMFVPTAETALRDQTTPEDMRRFREHPHPAVTVASDVAAVAKFIIEREATDPATGALRESHELHVDSRLPARSWHAGPPRQ
jgi:hypothetical protein